MLYISIYTYTIYLLDMIYIYKVCQDSESTFTRVWLAMIWGCFPTTLSWPWRAKGGSKCGRNAVYAANDLGPETWR